MRRFRQDHGAAAVEFGLLLPLVMLILCGIIDFGLALNAQVTLTQAAREGARLESFDKPGDEVIARAAGAAIGLDGVEAVIVTGCPGGDGTVRVTYDFEFLTPVGAFGAMFGDGGYGDPITLIGEGVMPCET